MSDVFGDNIIEFIQFLIIISIIWAIITALAYVFTYFFIADVQITGGIFFVTLIIVIILSFIILFYKDSKRKSNEKSQLIKNLNSESRNDELLINKVLNLESTKKRILCDLYGIPFTDYVKLIEFISAVNDGNPWNEVELNEFLNVDDESAVKYYGNPPEKIINKIFVRDKYSCQICGKNLKNEINQSRKINDYIFHVKPISPNYKDGLKEENLMTICTNCKPTLERMRRSFRLSSRYMEIKKVSNLENHISNLESHMNKCENNISHDKKIVNEIEVENKKLDNEINKLYDELKNDMEYVEDIYYTSGATDENINEIFGSYRSYVYNCLKYYDNAKEKFEKFNKNNFSNIELRDISLLEMDLNNYLKGMKTPWGVMDRDVHKKVKDKQYKLIDLVNKLSYNEPIYKIIKQKDDNIYKINRYLKNIKNEENKLKEYNEDYIEKKAWEFLKKNERKDNESLLTEMQYSKKVN